MAGDFFVAEDGDSRVRAHQGADGTAGTLVSFICLDGGSEVTLFIDMGGESENAFGAGMDAEAAPFTSLRVDDDVARADSLSNNHFRHPLRVNLILSNLVS
jgi:hypothetical protein